MANRPLKSLCLILACALLAADESAAQIGGAGLLPSERRILLPPTSFGPEANFIYGGSANDEAEEDVDLAYGAFQRGFYLTALKHALERAAKGDAAAQTLIAEMYSSGLGVSRDLREAASWYKLAAVSGDRSAQFAYATMLLDGKTSDSDPAIARRFLEQSAGAGHARAKFNLAQLIVGDNPNLRGFTKALPLYREAAELGVSDAYYALSQYYLNGLGNVSADPQQARHWLLRAARAGIDTAQVELGIMLANLPGDARDLAGALAWIRLSARSGNAIGQNRLAHMFAKGVGTAADPIAAGKWHILASRAGLGDPWLEEFFQDMTLEQRQTALRAANRWPLS